MSFAELLHRIRPSFTGPAHPLFDEPPKKTARGELLHVHRERDNVYNFIHLPVQHGNTAMLERMRRTYSREEYLSLVERARRIVPGLALSTDIIAGFCGETEEEHGDTLSLMEAVRYDPRFNFIYSNGRGPTRRRSTRTMCRRRSKRPPLGDHRTTVGALANVTSATSGVFFAYWLRPSRKSDEQLCGRTDSNKMVVFDDAGFVKGQYVDVRVERCTSATLLGTAVSSSANKLEASSPATTVGAPQ
ncbi:MAG: radical SAM protein [Rhodothermales bacterium]